MMRISAPQARKFQSWFVWGVELANSLRRTASEDLLYKLTDKFPLYCYDCQYSESSFYNIIIDISS